MNESKINSWQNIEFNKIIKGKPRHGLYKPLEYFGHGSPIIKMGTQSNNPFIDDPCIKDKIEVTDKEITKYQVFNNDLLFLRTSLVMEGTGKCSIIKKISQPTIFVSNLIAITIDDKKADPLFYYYYFSSEQGRTKILSLCEQTAAATIRSSDLNILLIPYPSLSVQRRIAHILGSLDDKIELNRQMNGTLEAMAWEIFKSWFVDFDPIRAKAEGKEPAGMDVETAALFPDGFEEVDGREVPRGWKIKPLSEIANFLNGLALQNYPANTDDQYLPVIKIAQLRAGNTIGSDKANINIPPEYVIEDGDILFSWSGSLVVTVWCGGKGALNQHLFKVSSELFPKWFFYHWILHYLPEFQLIAEGKATTMGHIQRHHLSEMMVLVPPPHLIEVMDKMMAPLLDKIISNNIESRIIAEIRDSLLPKLMTGNIRI